MIAAIAIIAITALAAVLVFPILLRRNDAAHAEGFREHEDRDDRQSGGQFIRNHLR